MENKFKQLMYDDCGNTVFVDLFYCPKQEKYFREDIVEVKV